MKILKNKTFLAICIFIMAIQFVSVVLAAKPSKPQPPPPRTYSEKYGYAILEVGNMITGDIHDQYIDIENVTTDDSIYCEGEIKRGDKIRVLSYDDNGELIWLRAFIGKPELPYRSPRRAMFNFDLLNDAATTPGVGKAVYDILSYETAGGDLRGNLVDGKYYLNDGTVHFVVAIGSCDFFGEGTQAKAMFMIDPGCEAESPLAITQTTVDAFYDNYDNDDNPKYWTAKDGAALTSGDEDPHDQISYHLFVDQLNVEASDTNNDNKADTWVITPKIGDVEIRAYVYKNISSNKNRPNYKYVAEPLATYASIPFKLTLSLSPFDTTPAPARLRTSATFWGEIKSK